MAAINTVQQGLPIRLPMTGMAPPRVLMCSASMGAEGSVTLQLREAVQAPDSDGSPMDGSVTIGYPDPDMLADMLGSIQAAGSDDNKIKDKKLTESESSLVDGDAALSGNIIGSSATSGSLQIHNSHLPHNIIISSNSNSSNSSSSSSSSSNSSTCSNVSSITIASSSMTSAANGGSGMVTSSDCGASSTTSSKKNRVKAVSPTRHGPQQCQVCSKIFGNASALAKHKLTHSDERKYVCGMCSKAFKRQDHLNGHMLTHRNKKPYECKADGCGKSYCDARSLRRHTENHHSALGLTPTTPPNQSMLSGTSTGPPTGLSLSPSTASGDASSPHGATCIQYSGDGSKPGSPSSPAGAGNEGLTRQQLDLISQIMQQTKQANAAGIAAAATAVASSPTATASTQSKPSIQQVTTTTNSATAPSTSNPANSGATQRPRTWNMQTQLQQSLPQKTTSNATQPPVSSPSDERTAAQSTSSTPGHSTTTTIKTSSGTSKGSESKGDHGPVECNLCHRKFKNVPALNGHMRLHGGYFKKDTETKKCDKKETPGPPLQTASVGIRALIEEKIINKRSKEIKASLLAASNAASSFVVPAPPMASRRLLDSDSSKLNGLITVVTSNLPHSTTLAKTSPITSTAVTSKSSLLDGKDATLIELLKRGTKVAVKRTFSDPGQLVFSSNSHAATTSTTVSPNTSSKSANTNTSPVRIHSSPTSHKPSAATSHSSSSSCSPRRSAVPTSTLNPPIGGCSATTPLALTISQAPSDSGDVFTLAYSADTSTAAFFGDNDVYNIPDTAMLLQAVDSIQLLHDSNTSTSQLDDIASLSDYNISEGGILTEVIDDIAPQSSRYTPSTQLQAVLNSPLPESLAEFSTLHSKDYAMLYGCQSTGSPHAQSSSHGGSPLPSPLAYPTPPASHETIAQASPFLDETHHFVEANSYFDDKRSIHYMDDNSPDWIKQAKSSNLSDTEQILKLKHELFQDSKSVIDENMFFKTEPEDVYERKASDLLADTTTIQPAGISDFNQNLSFFDEPQNFLDDARNTSSPLSAAFFTATMSSAEEVKEALEEVLPNENDGSSDSVNEMDLYYLSALTLQSQMMLNSDDPLLSSSPKDFAHKHQVNKFDFNMFCPPATKRCKQEMLQQPVKVEMESVYLNTENTTPSKSVQPGHSATILRKRPSITSRKNVTYKSKLRRTYAPHFTPLPILNPDRNSTGLYSTIVHDILDDDDDDVIDFDFGESACVPEFMDKSRVNIGSDFQSQIPPLRSCYIEDKEFSDDEPDGDELVWHPGCVPNEQQVLRFVELSKSSAVPLGCHSEETALRALLESGGVTPTAILRLMQTVPEPLQKRWQQNEIETFLRGLEEWGKDFQRISQEIEHKTPGECVQLYYFWKKLSVDYKVTYLGANTEATSSAPTPIVPAPAVHHPEVRAHVCEMPDCSASFSSKAALHGHIRIHCIARSNSNNSNHNHSNVNGNNNSNHYNNMSGGSSQNGAAGPNASSVQSGTSHGFTTKDEYPCKVCGKVFNKVKSRSAHMKTHRPPDIESSPVKDQ